MQLKQLGLPNFEKALSRKFVSMFAKTENLTNVAISKTIVGKSIKVLF